MNANIAVIDMTKRKVHIKSLPESTLKECIGGRGLALYLLKEYWIPGAYPLDPDNPLIITTGPLSGLRDICASAVLSFRSPLTKTYSDCYLEGDFGGMLKKAGFDALVIYGRAQVPLYLLITEGKIEFRNALSVWYSSVHETLEYMYEDAGIHGSSLVIGPAGSYLVRPSGVIVDGVWLTGRGGAGLVLGVKRLKGILVYGDRELTVRDYDSLYEVWAQNLKSSVPPNPLSTLGLPSISKLVPYRNFNTLEEECGLVRELDVLRVGVLSCKGCPMGCSLIYRTSNGLKTIDVNSALMLGPNLGVCSLENVLELMNRCRDLGLEPISTGAILSWFMEIMDRKYITEEDTDGLSIEFGDMSTILEVLDLIAHRKGFGAIMAEGVMRASRIINKGTDRSAVHVAGLEMGSINPIEDPMLQLMYLTALSPLDILSLRDYLPSLPRSLEELLELRLRKSLAFTLPLCGRYPIEFKFVREILKYSMNLDLKEDKLKFMSKNILKFISSIRSKEGLKDYPSIPSNKVIKRTPLLDRLLRAWIGYFQIS